MKSCLNCKHLAQNYSKLSEYKQSIANSEEDYTCESGKGFSPTWLFGNPGMNTVCGQQYYERNPDKEAVAKVTEKENQNRIKAIQKL